MMKAYYIYTLQVLFYHQWRKCQYIS